MFNKKIFYSLTKRKSLSKIQPPNKDSRETFKKWDKNSKTTTQLLSNYLANQVPV